MSISIKDAPLVEKVKEEIKIPISDGSGTPKSINISQIKDFSNKEVITTIKELEDRIKALEENNADGLFTLVKDETTQEYYIHTKYSLASEGAVSSLGIGAGNGGDIDIVTGTEYLHLLKDIKSVNNLVVGAVEGYSLVYKNGLWQGVKVEADLSEIELDITKINTSLTNLNNKLGPIEDAYNKIKTWFTLLEDKQTLVTEYNLASKYTVSSLGISTEGDEPSVGGANALYQLYDVLRDGDAVAGASEGNSLVYKDGKWQGVMVKADLSEIERTISDIETALNNHDKAINANKKSIDTLSEQVSDIKDAYDIIKTWFTVSEDGQTLKTTYNLASTKTVSSLGVGSDNGGSGVSYDRLDNWDNYNEGDGSVLSSDLGYGLLERIIDLEESTSGDYASIEEKVNKNTNAITNLSTSLNDFLTGVDVDDTINRWKELEKFLEGYTETATLADLLKGKVDTEAYNTAINGVNETLGIHTTAINSNAANITSINTTLLNHNTRITDNANAINEIEKTLADWFTLENGVLHSKYGLASDKTVSSLGVGSDGGGGVSYNRLDSWDSYTDDKAGYVLSAALGWDLKDRLDNLDLGDFDLSGYQPLIEDLAIIRTNAALGKEAQSWGNHANEGYATEKWVTDKNYATAVALNALGDAFDSFKVSVADTYFKKDNFTKTNIKDELSISDWALTETKPTYNADEVSEKSENPTNLYFTTNRVKDYLTGAISTVLTSDLTALRVLVSDGSGKIAASTNITTDELNSLDGVTGKIQTQLNNLSNRVKAYEDILKIEDDGKLLHAIVAFASDSTVSSLGIGSESGGGGGGGVINLTNVVSDIIPSENDYYSIGSLDNYWTAIYVNDVNASVIEEGGLRVATRNWVESNYILNSELDDYVTKSGYQTISGKKYFTGGIDIYGQLNGYLSDGEYRSWYIDHEGNGVFTSLKIGVEAVALAKDIPSLEGYATQAFVTSQGYMKFNDVTGLIESYAQDNINGKYLLVSGGTLYDDNSELPLHIKGGSTGAYIGFKLSNNTDIGYIGVNDAKDLIFGSNKVLHAGNTSFSAELTTGTKIGTITIGGTATDLYAPVGSSADLSNYYTKEQVNSYVSQEINTFSEENLGTAASKGVTTSVTNGSNDLITSGGVYTKLSNYVLVDTFVELDNEVGAMASTVSAHEGKWYNLTTSTGLASGYIKQLKADTLDLGGSVVATTDDLDDFARKATTLSGYGITDALPLSGGTIDGELTVMSRLSTNSYLNFGIYGSMIMSDIRNSWRTSVFGDSDNDSKLMTIRTDVSITDFSEIYGSGIVWCTGDTHGYLSVSYGSEQAFIGGGNGDSLNWSHTLIHSGNIGSQSVNYANSAGYTSFYAITTNNGQVMDANLLHGGMFANYYGIEKWKNAPSGMSYGSILSLTGSGYNSLSGQLAWDVNHNGADSTRFLWWRANDDMNFVNAKWHQIAFTDSNVASADFATAAKYIRPTAGLDDPYNYPTVKSVKDVLVSLMQVQDAGIGDNIVISSSVVGQWNDDSASTYYTSVYSVIKIGGGYGGSTYGQWLLSSYGDSRVGYVGRNENVWGNIHWLATLDDIYTRQQIDDKISALSGGNAFTGGSVVSSIYPSTNNGASLGTSNNKWAELYVSNIHAGGTISAYGDITTASGKFIGNLIGTASSAGYLNSLTSQDKVNEISTMSSWYDWATSSNYYRYGLLLESPDHNYKMQLCHSIWNGIQIRASEGGTWGDWRTLAFTDSNVASADKLSTPRTIWGQSFDGSGDITKTSIGTMRYLYFSSSDGTYNTGYVGRGGGGDNIELITYGAYNIDLGTNGGVNMRINSSGNVTIGSNDLAGTSYKLYVNGDSYVNGSLTLNNNYNLMFLNSSSEALGTLALTSTNDLVMGWGTAGKSYNTYIDGYNVNLRYGASHTTGILLKSTGDVEIANSLTVSGTSSFNDSIDINNGDLCGYEDNVQNWIISPDGGASFNSLTMSGPISFSIASSNDTASSHYVSAGGGYSANSGKYGIKIVCCDQHDAQTGLGQDLTGLNGGYELTVAGGLNADGGYGYISFATHTVNSKTYRQLGYFKDYYGTISFHVNGNIYINGETAATQSWVNTAILEALNTFNEENLGTAASYGVTTSVTSGSTSLVTSGGVASALSGYISKNGGAVTGTLSIGSTRLNVGSTTLHGDVSLEYGALTLTHGNIGSSYWSITNDGAATVRTLSQTSDITKKNVLSDIRLSLGTMANAPLIKFTWADGLDSKLHAGTIAQYWDACLPEVVSTTTNGTLALSYGELGVAMGISLAKEMTEMLTRIDNTDSEVDKLKKRISELEKEIENLKSL